MVPFFAYRRPSKLSGIRPVSTTAVAVAITAMSGAPTGSVAYARIASPLAVLDVALPKAGARLS